jgi:hypothetical protein
MYTLYEIRETDSNDCTVFDCIVEGNDREDCDAQIAEHFDALAERGNWESDGNFCSYYFPCNCESPDEPETPAIPCDSCQVVSIIGVACHETGCPAESRYRRELRAYERWEDRDCSHGGLTVDGFNAQEFETEDDAENARSRYHSLYTI